MSPAMDGVLEKAALVCLCKLACSLLFLPAVTGSVSAFSFCCSCLLLFTDLMVTTFLLVLWFLQYSQPQFSTSTDVIALHFLLFLSYTYWAVLLMTTPLIAVETAMRLQLSEGHDGEDGEDETMDKDTDEAGKTPGSKALRFYSGLKMENGKRSETVRERTQTAGTESQDQDRCLSHTYFLCCLLVWALCAGHGLRLLDLSVKDCLERTSALILCLPSIPDNVLLALGEARWDLTRGGLSVMTFTLLLVLTVGLSLLRQHWAHQETDPGPPSETTAVPGMSCAVPAATWSRCSAYSLRTGNNRQLLLGHHRDSVLLSVECLSVDRLEGENETKRKLPLSTTGDRLTPSAYLKKTQRWLRERGFPCLEEPRTEPERRTISPNRCSVLAMDLSSRDLPGIIRGWHQIKISRTRSAGVPPTDMTQPGAAEGNPGVETPRSSRCLSHNV
ncbi:hypothetical protein DPEC_G00205720 [Dallia pectoralis]|uniref:Uncharacterized protein n=1 Tax=Dallia pectoralis TaxID=75939 RepID=A0ACC2G4M6_DALPE|nr:hypothetical protein DPEC_G00205720 [Dallia pectoralis]